MRGAALPTALRLQCACSGPGRGAAASVRVVAAAELPPARRARRQSHVGRSGRAREASLLRRPSVRQREHFLRFLPSSGARFYRRECAGDRVHGRASRALANVAYNASFTWANPNLTRLEEQIRIPLLNENPVELGVAGNEGRVLATLRAAARYRALFARAFPEAAEPIALDNVIKALACFVRTLVSGDSAYDRLVYLDERAEMPPSALRGMRLFFSRRMRCSECHSGFNFSGPVRHAGGRDSPPSFHNTGLYNLEGRGLYPSDNLGLREFTGHVEDTGRFRAPTLRNIELTAPYMHDGSVATLEDVLEHYAVGGRGSGAPSTAAENPYTSPLVAGFALTESERADLVSFLHSLTDRSFVVDPRFASPFTRP